MPCLRGRANAPERCRTYHHHPRVKWSVSCCDRVMSMCWCGKRNYLRGNHVNNGHVEDHTLKPWINTRSSVFLIVKSASRVSPCDNLESEDRQGSEMRLLIRQSPYVMISRDLGLPELWIMRPVEQQSNAIAVAWIKGNHELTGLLNHWPFWLVQYITNRLLFSNTSERANLVASKQPRELSR